MVDEPAAGKRFSRDLRQIREERDVSIDEVHSKTRIARTLIESFEEGRLYAHESYNRVYLRSFVRAYAEAIDIPVQPALDGLDAALDGTYEGTLAEEYLHAPSESKEENDHSPSASGAPDVEEEEDGLSGAPSAGGPEGRGGIVGPPRAVGDDPDASDELTTSSSNVSSDSPETDPSSTSSGADAVRDDDQESSPPDSHSSEEQVSERSPSSSSDEPEPEDGTEVEAESDSDGPGWLEESGEDEAADERPSASSFSEQGDPGGGRPESSAADMGGGGIVGEPTPLGSSSEDEPSLDRSKKKGRPDRGRSSQSAGWFAGDRREMYLSGVGVAIVVVVGGILGFLYLSSGNSAPQDEPAVSPVSDTAASTASADTATAESQRPPPANLQLGETLHLTVLAESNVSDMRVRRDDDLRRPYWIQEGQASVFLFEQQAILQNELEDVQLFLEGYPYPMPKDTTGGIEITRSEVEAFADTLRGPPASLSVEPDTIPVGAPAE